MESRRNSRQSLAENNFRLNSGGCWFSHQLKCDQPRRGHIMWFILFSEVKLESELSCVTLSIRYAVHVSVHKVM